MCVFEAMHTNKGCGDPVCKLHTHWAKLPIRKLDIRFSLPPYLLHLFFTISHEVSLEKHGQYTWGAHDREFVCVAWFIHLVNESWSMRESCISGRMTNADYWFQQRWEKSKRFFLALSCRGIANKQSWMKKWRTVLPWRMFLCSSSSADGLWLSRLRTQTAVDNSFLKADIDHSKRNMSWEVNSSMTN